MPRTSLVLLFGLLAGCAPDSTSPNPRASAGDVRAIHIAHRGTVVDSVLRTGALGDLSLSLLVEAGNGSLISQDVARTIWGSTHPAVMDETFRSGTEVYFHRTKEGRARIIAGVGSLRDTVTIEVKQVVARAHFDVDTMVTLAPGARDLSGAPTAYHTFVFGTQRVDSNGYFLMHTSTARIVHTPIGDPPFDIFTSARGDTVALAGRAQGHGRIVVTFAGRSDTLTVQVADAYRVVRLSMSVNLLPGGDAGPPPAPITIPAGAAIIFRNETALPVLFEGATAGAEWRVGVIPPGSHEAQRFDTPGRFDFSWANQRSTIIVTAGPPGSP